MSRTCAGFVLLQKSFSHLYILAFSWSIWSYPEWNEWKYVSVVEQIGLNVLNAKCLETGILSRDNPPHGLNTVSQELTQTQEFLEPKSIITLHLLFQEMESSKNERIHHHVALRSIVTIHIMAAAHTGRPVGWWAYLENIHGRLAHSRPIVWRRDMDAEGVLGVVVQKVPCLSPVFPAHLTLAMGKHRLLSERDLWRHGWWRVGTLEALVEARQDRGSTEDPSPPKGKERRE